MSAGALTGTFNELVRLNGIFGVETIDSMLAWADDWGGPGSFPHMTAAWAVATDAPFTYTKQNAGDYGVKNNFVTIDAELELRRNDSGVIIAQGGKFGGWALYMDQGKPTYTYNWFGLESHTVQAPKPVRGKSIDDSAFTGRVKSVAVSIPK